MRLAFDIKLSPGIPVSDTLQALFEVLVADRPLFQVKRRLRSTGPDLDPETAAAELTAYVESGKAGVQLTRHGEDPFMSLLLTKSPKFASNISGYLVDNDVASVMAKSHQLLDVVDAYVVRVEGREPSGAQINARNRQAMDAVKTQVDGAPGAYWPRFLLCGLGHRMILSDEIVEFIGAEQIAALPADLAWRENGRQVIAGTADPIPLPTGRYDPQEKLIIDALGATDAFFNPETGELPTRVPELTPARPIRFWNNDGIYTLN